MASSIVEQNQSLKMSSLAGARAGPGSGGPLRGRGLARSRGADEWGGCGRCCEEGDVLYIGTGTKQKGISGRRYVGQLREQEAYVLGLETDQGSELGRRGTRIHGERRWSKRMCWEGERGRNVLWEGVSRGCAGEGGRRGYVLERCTEQGGVGKGRSGKETEQGYVEERRGRAVLERCTEQGGAGKGRSGKETEQGYVGERRGRAVWSGRG
jgi:hypothetical protein